MSIYVHLYFLFFWIFCILWAFWFYIYLKYWKVFFCKYFLLVTLIYSIWYFLFILFYFNIYILGKELIIFFIPFIIFILFLLKKYYLLDFILYIKNIKKNSKIDKLSNNLDKQIDKKIIEYNNLISRQREFIIMSSHEIKTPVASSIFLIDWLINDVNEWNCNKKEIIWNLKLLNEQFVKLWELVNKIFQIQKYDIKKIDLFIEKVNLENLLLKKIERFKKEHIKINFTLNIDKKIWFVEIDKVQFKQVIDNLLNNSLKFCKNLRPIIDILVKIKKKNIIISIEDNWEWFKNIDVKTIFNKYISWNKNYWNNINFWIWMWLYLCKKIIEKHNWKIKARVSNKLWWAKFIINIPIQYKKK